MDLTLHIGTHKTGTSSIQACMEANRARLRAAGFHYPRCCSAFDGNHSPLCAAMVRDPRDDRWEGMPGWDDFVAECRQAGAPTVLVSAELFSARLRNRQHALRIRDMFRGVFDTVTVVVYLRRQDEYVRSMYMEAVKHGFFNKARLAPTFAESAAQIAERQGDYLALLRNLDEAFGRENLRVRVFEKGQLRPGGLLPDFLDACGIPAAGLDLAAGGLVNVSPGRKVVTAMHLGRHVYEGLFGEAAGMRHRVGIMGRAHSILVEAWPGDAKYLGYPAGGARALVEGFRASNEAVAREYLGRADGALFRSERYAELAEGERDEVPLSFADVRLVVTAIDISHAVYRRRMRKPWIAYLRRHWAIATHRARSRARKGAAAP